MTAAAMLAAGPAPLVLVPGNAQPLLTGVHSGSRPCVHLLSDTIPMLVLFSRDTLAGLNFQPRITAKPSPVIASRTGDILTISFDHIGPILARSHIRRDGRPRHTYRYQLQPVILPSQTEPDPHTVAGMLIEDGHR